MTTLSGEMVNTPEAWSERASLASSWDAAGWTRDGQRDRFDAVAAHLAETGSLLDFGCGTGAFSDWCFPQVAYHGYDWAPGMLDRARREHPGKVFVDSIDGLEFDMVVAIGPFNLPGSVMRTKVDLQRLWASTRSLLAVSLYRGGDERCLSYTLDDCADIVDLCRAGSFLVDGSYRANDLLLVMWR